MRAADLARVLRAVLVELEAIEHERPEPSPRWYSRSRLPPGCRSWRAARETARRRGIPMARPGRDVVIDAVAWDAVLASEPKKSAAAPLASAWGCSAPRQERRI